MTSKNNPSVCAIIERGDVVATRYEGEDGSEYVDLDTFADGTIYAHGSVWNRIKLAFSLVAFRIAEVRVLHSNALSRDQAIKLNDELISEIYYDEYGDYEGEMISDSWYSTSDEEEPHLYDDPDRQG